MGFNQQPTDPMGRSSHVPRPPGPSLVPFALRGQQAIQVDAPNGQTRGLNGWFKHHLMGINMMIYGIELFMNYMKNLCSYFWIWTSHWGMTTYDNLLW